MDFDLIIANGTIIDGSGRPRFRGDIGLRDGRIAAVSTGAPLVQEPSPGAEVIDAKGLIVAPGFIDVHSHVDWILPLPDHDRILGPLLLQGITTVVAGQCGFSPAPATEFSPPLLDDYSESLRARAFPYAWNTMGEFLDHLEAGGVFLNAACLVGHGALRYAAMGPAADTTQPPTPEQVAEMRRLAGQALEEGAFGMSAGLGYAPGVFAANDELSALLQVVAEVGRVFTVHGRAYTWTSPFYRPMFLGPAHNLRSVRELLTLARRSGVRMQLSHQIFVGRRTWRTYRAVLLEIDWAVRGGVDVSMDAFPYTYGNSTIKVVFPEWFLDGFEENLNDPDALRRLKREIWLLRLALGLDYGDIILLYGQSPETAALEGLDLRAIAQRLDMEPFEAYMHIARLSGGKARILLGTYSGAGDYEVPLRAVLAHPRCGFMTDSILTGQGRDNPASYGTFPRVLGRYSRDLDLFPLEEAVRRMTSFSAERMGLQGVGRVAEGYWADLVVFNPATVADRTTLEQPDVPPAGIEAVLISGQVAARGGQIVSPARLGRVMRK